MEPLQSQSRRRQLIDRRAALAGIAFSALAPLGCLGVGKRFAKKNAVAPVEPQGRLVTTWDKKVVYAPDVQHGGAVIPGLVGRVYLFGSDVKEPYIGDGSLLIDMWDSSPRGPGIEPRQIEHCRIYTPDVLKKFAKTDIIGPGYSIFLPWPSYRPDVTQVYISVLYSSAAGEQFFHQSGTFTVDHSETSERVRKGQPVAVQK